MWVHYQIVCCICFRGETDSGTPFREAYATIGELRSILVGTPIIGLTATASNSTIKKICQSLHMHLSNEQIVMVNPNKENIT